MRGFSIVIIHSIPSLALQSALTLQTLRSVLRVGSVVSSLESCSIWLVALCGEGCELSVRLRDGMG